MLDPDTYYIIFFSVTSILSKVDTESCRLKWNNFFFSIVTDVCLNVNIQDVNKGFYKNARFVKHQGHTEWARQGDLTIVSCISVYDFSIRTRMLSKPLFSASG